MKDQLYPEPENPYEFEKELKNTGKVKATGLVTTALIVAGGLLGGAAFAVNAQGSPVSDQLPSTQTVVDNGSPVVNPTDSPVPAPTASDSAQPLPVDTGTAPAPGSSASQGQPTSDAGSSAAPSSSSSQAPAPAPAPSSTPKTIAVPPTVSFGGGGDDSGEHHSGKHNRSNQGSNANNPGGPNFSNGDDNGGDD